MTEIKQNSFGMNFFTDFDEYKFENEGLQNIYTQYIQDLDFQIKNLGGPSNIVINESDLNFLEEELDFAIESLGNFENLNKINQSHTSKKDSNYSGLKNFLNKYSN
jgi:hypothetical protein